MPNVLDKYTPTYDLESFKQSKYEIKMSAIRGAFALGFHPRHHHRFHSSIFQREMRHAYGNDQIRCRNRRKTHP